MNYGLSKTLLRQVLDAVVAYSSLLDPFRRAPELAVDRQAVAKQAFGRVRSKNKLSELLRTERSAGKRQRWHELRADDVEILLQAFRFLLQRQYQHLKPVHLPTPAQFEASVCQRFGLSGTVLHTKHFDLQSKVFTASSSAEFGVPDMITWKGVELVDDLAQKQRASLELLQVLRPGVEMAASDARRLALLHVAISLAGLHHPGTAFHEVAVECLRDIGDAAGVVRLAHSADEAVRLEALRMQTHVRWCSFAPHLESPTNYLPLILAGRRLDRAVWRRVHPLMDLAIATSRQQLQIAPSSSQVLREHASIASLKARLLLTLGSREALREADHLHRESVANLPPGDVPYAMLYPILRHVVRRNVPGALRECEAVIQCHRGVNLTAEQAFAALRFQLTALDTGSPSEDSLRDLARTAVASPSIRYQYSHVFNAQGVATLLGKQARRRRRGYRVH